MKITGVRYERVANLGNYETERVAVEVLVEDGETPQMALLHAKLFVNAQLGIEELTEEEIAKMERRLARAKRRGC